jgi:hypothetical protein
MKKILPTCLVLFCWGLGIGTGIQVGSLGGSTLGKLKEDKELADN